MSSFVGTRCCLRTSRTNAIASVSEKSLECERSPTSPLTRRYQRLEPNSTPAVVCLWPSPFGSRVSVSGWSRKITSGRSFWKHLCASPLPLKPVTTGSSRILLLVKYLPPIHEEGWGEVCNAGDLNTPLDNLTVPCATDNQLRDLLLLAPKAGWSG